MCGILGFISPHLPKEESASIRSNMLQRIFHRGPDEEGVWENEADGVWLGMRRLSIISLHDGTQPLWNENRDLGVFFNGEIYNYLELRQDLIAKGHTFLTQSDTEVLVHGFEEEGLDFVQKLRGMFAIALFDPIRRQIHLIRDFFGQKPLYWFHHQNSFVFASEIKALKGHPDFPKEIREEALLPYLSWYSLPPPETHYHGVHKLEPGTWMKIQWSGEGEIRLSTPTRYGYPSRAPHEGSFEEAAEELDCLLDESLKIHLRSDVPLGLFLSGGLDSRAIGTFAKRHLTQNIQSYTVIFEEDHDDARGARKTAAHLGSQHHEVFVGVQDFHRRLDALIYHLDEPMGDPASFAVMLLSEVASKDVKVVLSGEGSDELFAGYDGRYLGTLDAIQRSNRLRRMFSPFRMKPMQRLPLSRVERLRWKLGIQEHEEIPIIRLEGLPGFPPRLYSTAQQAFLLQRASEYGARVIPKTGSTLQKLQNMDMRWQLPEYLLQKADKMSMSASIELRGPFLDPKLYQFAQSLPDAFKLQTPQGPGKRILRETLKNRGDTESYHIPKQGFPMPIGAWLRGPLKHEVEGVLLDSGARSRNFFSQSDVKQLWQDFQERKFCSATLFYALWLYERWRAAEAP